MIKKYLLTVLILLILSKLIYADDNAIVVIANRNSGIQVLSHTELVNIYLGRTKKLASGVTVTPIDLPINSDEKKLFYQQLVHKSPAEIQAYWARLVFTGQANQPVEIDNAQDILKMIQKNQNTIAYINRKNINSSVIIVHELSRNLN